MITKTIFSAALVLIVLPAYCFAPGSDQEPDRCPYCRLPIKTDVADTDFRVTMTHGGKTAAYRCVLCALADAKSMKGDLEISAASDKKGEPVKISRVGGKWALQPEGAVFAYAQGSHMQCQGRYRALRSSDSFAAYAKANEKYSFSAKPLTLKELLAVADK